MYKRQDLELYEFFKSQGAAIVNDASDFAGTNGCYLYQGRDVKAVSYTHLFVIFSGLVFAPQVNFRQAGLLHLLPTRFASIFILHLTR